MTSDIAQPPPDGGENDRTGTGPTSGETLAKMLKRAGGPDGAAISKSWAKAFRDYPSYSETIKTAMADAFKASAAFNARADLSTVFAQVGELGLANSELIKSGAASMSALVSEQASTMRDALLKAGAPPENALTSIRDLIASQRNAVGALNWLPPETSSVLANRARRETRRVHTELELSRESGLRISRAEESETVTAQVVEINEGVARVASQQILALEVLQAELSTINATMQRTNDYLDRAEQREKRRPGFWRQGLMALGTGFGAGLAVLFFQRLLGV